MGIAVTSNTQKNALLLSTLSFNNYLGSFLKITVWVKFQNNIKNQCDLLIQSKEKLLIIQLLLLRKVNPLNAFVLDRETADIYLIKTRLVRKKTQGLQTNLNHKRMIQKQLQRKVLAIVPVLKKTILILLMIAKICDITFQLFKFCYQVTKFC